MAYILNDSSVKELNELETGRMGMLNKDKGLGGNYTSRILVIGLGGMGLKTIIRLKSELIDRVGQINSSYLQFLSIDTDKVDRQKALDSGILTPEETPQLNNSSIAAALGAPPAQRPVTIENIIPQGFKQALTGAGANQVRLAGRLTVMDLNLFSEIYNSIKNAVSALQNFNAATLDVHVVAGVGGGSGSGLVIDIPYIVRAVVNDLVGQGGALRLFGHIYLPNAYSGISNPKAAYRNGYAALKEIDYYMNIESIGETFDAKYPQPVGDFSSQENIFTQCTLIGGKIAGKMVITNPQEKALSVCVDDLVNLCTSVIGKVDGMENGGAISDFFTNESFQVNADTALNTVMNDAELNFPPYGNYSYNLIGASSIKFPTAAIVEQLIGEISKKADERLRSNVGSLDQKAVDTFEHGLLKPTEIIDREARKLETKIDEILENPDVVWNKKTILTNTHTSTLDVELTKAIERFDKDNTIVERAVAEANSKAAEIFKDPNRGPYYLAELLTSRSSAGGKVVGLYQLISNYFGLTDSLKTKYSDSYAEFENKKRDLEKDMQSLGRFNRNLPTYKSVLKEMYSTSLKITLCDRLKANYYVDLNQQRGATYQLKLSLDNNFLTYVDIYSALADIIEVNRKTAEGKLSASSSSDPTSIFSLNDPVFIPLKSTVMSAVSRKVTQLGADGPANYAAALTSDMMDNRDEWALTTNCMYGRSKTAKRFRNFIDNYQPFDDIVNSKMIDYFDEAYQGQTDSQKNMVVQKLIDQIKDNSAPMCNVWNPPYFNFASVAPLCYQYLVLPNGFNQGANGWDQRFTSLFITSNVTDNIYWSPDQDAIYSYTLYARMPLWIHRDLEDYEEEYNKDQSVGVHTNEGKTQRTPLRKYPALMIPSQWVRTRVGTIEYSNSDELKVFDDVGKTFRYAVDHGIVSKDSNGKYVINIIQDKPDPKTSKRIQNFIEGYTTSPENVENGIIKLKKQLFNAMRETFGSREVPIYDGRRGYMPTDEEHAINLLRKQMKCYEALCDEIAYYKTNFVPDIQKQVDDWKKKQIRNDLSKYMLFGLVFQERGIWKYKLGDTVYNIVAAFEVQNNPAISWQVQFMEIAVCNKLNDMKSDPDTKAKMDAHKKLLDDRANALQMQIANGDDAVFNDLKSNYDALRTRCESVVNTITTREINGNVLTANEIEEREFYRDILSFATNLVALFGIN